VLYYRSGRNILPLVDGAVLARVKRG
jgi:hypothetical protein